MRWRLFLSFALIVLITLLSLGYWLRQGTLEAVDTFAQRGGFIGADPLVSALEEYYRVKQTWEGADIILNNLPPTTDQNRPGNAFPQAGGQMVGRAQKMSLLDEDGNVIYGQDELGGLSKLNEEQLQYAIPLKSDSKTVGYLLPIGGAFQRNLDFEKTLSERITNAAWKASLIAGTLSLALAFMLGYLLIKPVRTLTKAASRLAEGDLNQHVDVSGSGELAALSKTFNHMASSLQQAEARRQAMTADIAHELRTPLAVQRANLEAIQDGIYHFDQENLELILEQNKLLSRLVEDLRTLALTDADELTLYKETTDIAALTEQVVDQFRPGANQAGISLIFEQKEILPQIEADPRRIVQILNNLLSNAVNHTPTGGQVITRLLLADRYIEIDIHDSGEGIPKEALPHIFERFYRSDLARSRQHGGSGLGLTIARKLAEAHGGSLSAENHVNGGALFRLRLPI